MATDLELVKKKFAFLLAQELAIACPKDTGFMAKSFTANYEINEDVITFTLPEYSKYVIFGTREHTIEAKNKEALAFKWGTAPINPPTVGGKFFFKKVVIPAMPPNFFIQETLINKGREIMKTAFRTSNKT